MVVQVHWSPLYGEIMKIKDFVKDAVLQIQEGCITAIMIAPVKISFTIQVNAQGEVAEPPDYVVATIKVDI